jgi:hypothetical protein
VLRPRDERLRASCRRDDLPRVACDRDELRPPRDRFPNASGTASAASRAIVMKNTKTRFIAASLFALEFEGNVREAVPAVDYNITSRQGEMMNDE